MTALSNKGEELVESMPVYSQDDHATRALLDAVGRELQRVEDFLLAIQENIQPQNADERFLRYWESFLTLPVDPPGVSNAQRLTTIIAAVRRRTAGPGTGWKSLLDTILAQAPWSHSENSDYSRDYEPYGFLFYDIMLNTTDYRVGIFQEMARRITPAHLEITGFIFTGDDTFRVGISEVGDTI